MTSEVPSGTDTSRTRVEVWLNEYPLPDHSDGIREAARRFEHEHPDIRVDISTHDFRSHPSAVRESVARGARPAVVQYFYSAAQEARDAVLDDGTPLFTPIDKAVGGRSEILGVPVVHDDLIPAVRDYYSYDGSFTAMPLLTSTTLLYANTSLLRAAGVSDLPRTWAELEEACRRVTAAPGGPPHGVTWPNHGWIIQQFVALQGALLADGANGRHGRARTVDLTSEAMLAYVDWCRRLHSDGLYLYTGNWGDGPGFASWRDNFAVFAEQRTAFVLSSSVDAEQMVGTGREQGFSVALAPLPYNGDRPRAGTMVGGDSLWLCSGLDPRVEDAALAFLQYLLSPENIAARHRRVRSVPVTRSSVELLEREGWFAQHPHERVAADALSASSGAPETLGAVLSGFDEIQDEMTRAVHDILTDGTEPRERLLLASQRAGDVLSRGEAHPHDPRSSEGRDDT
ncbi:ABC transporter substrate-binding protein [Nocardiopsis sp. FIRDI 009]|uniref:ABC transporter substrate-binding protein n=1 Tax=Nocardiopsis sp. FIRDI 009 TaxID=714197 RepID=UPI000E2408CF|nr:extracellular solute-binding protein [Nocardiopsis sp. FIRDI 009]